METRRGPVLTLVGVFGVAMAVGCGGRESTASRSAAEYDEALRKGLAVGGSGAQHGGHAADQPTDSGTAPMEGMEHSKMAGTTPGVSQAPEKPGTVGMEHSNMPGMKASASRASDKPGMAGMDHSKVPGMTAGALPIPAKPGTDPSNTAGMDHSNMAGMDHSKMSGMAGMEMPPPRPEPLSATATPGQPAATLRPDDIDRPSPSALEEAARSAAMAAEMAGGAHSMSHSPYQHVDADRVSDMPASGSKQAPKPKPSPTPHSHHDPLTPPAADPAVTMEPIH